MSRWIAEGNVRAQSHTLWVKSQNRPRNLTIFRHPIRQPRPLCTARKHVFLFIERANLRHTRWHTSLPANQKLRLRGFVSMSVALDEWVAWEMRCFFFVVLEISISALPTACFFALPNVSSTHSHLTETVDQNISSVHSMAARLNMSVITLPVWQGVVDNFDLFSVVNVICSSNAQRLNYKQTYL